MQMFGYLCFEVQRMWVLIAFCIILEFVQVEQARPSFLSLAYEKVVEGLE